MNIQTVSQRLRSLRCLVREIFEEMFYSKFIGLCMETPCLCPSEGRKYDGRKLTKTYVIEFDITSLQSSSEDS